VPVSQWGDGSPEFTIFNGYFQWDNSDWVQSAGTTVHPGDTVFGSVTYLPSEDAYNCHIASVTSRWSVTTKIAVEKGKGNYTDVYFVTEHQPSNCAQLPANGGVVFTNINIAWDNVLTQPTWKAAQFKPVCNCQAVVVSPSSVKFTWNTKGSVDPPQPVVAM
jgi:hypothetical protein